MKGILHKTGGQWIIDYSQYEELPIVRHLPIHPNDEYSIGYFGEPKEGKEVEFEQVSIWDTKANGYNIFAKLILLEAPTETWDDIFYAYMMENHPPHGAPYSNDVSLEDWLSTYYQPPKKK